MEFIASLIDKIGISFFTALICGVGLGVYLAAINNYIPVRSIKKSYITNAVIGLSFFLPIFLQRALSQTPDIVNSADRWAAAFILWLVFSTTADAVNWIICQWRAQHNDRLERRPQ